MSYRVEYGPAGEKEKTAGEAGGRLIALTAVCLLTFLILVNVFWPRGRDVLQRILWPGDSEVTQQAVEAFVDELRYGVSIGDAAEGFCLAVLKDGTFD